MSGLSYEYLANTLHYAKIASALMQKKSKGKKFTPPPPLGIKMWAPDTTHLQLLSNKALHDHSNNKLVMATCHLLSMTH